MPVLCISYTDYVPIIHYVILKMLHANDSQFQLKTGNAILRGHFLYDDTMVC